MRASVTGEAARCLSLPGPSLEDARVGQFQALAPLLQWGITSTLIRSQLQHLTGATGRSRGRRESLGRRGKIETRSKGLKIAREELDGLGT